SRVALDIRGTDESGRDVSVAAGSEVEIFPESLRTEATYGAGVLTLLPTSPGIRQLDLVVTADTGAKTKESFVYEVLPSHWGKTAVLAGDEQDAEADFNRQVLDGDDWVLATDAILTGRPLALRRSAV